jgi:hypothetical protein
MMFRLHCRFSRDDIFETITYVDTFGLKKLSVIARLISLTCHIIKDANGLDRIVFVVTISYTMFSRLIRRGSDNDQL